MKVYVVTRSYTKGGAEVIGVYTTDVLAVRHGASLINDDKAFHDRCDGLILQSYGIFIDEHKIDKIPKAVKMRHEQEKLANCKCESECDCFLDSDSDSE
jgi:hypothetical protein